ncbi:MAG: hypothetical protein K2P81_11685 [Bacteriovoracaceae bacterium]|nr:hypothetical protein [Bacteriovoracaceae bacterium]
MSTTKSTPALPFKRTPEEIEKYILAIPHQGVSIHKVSSTGDTFLITGSFSDKNKFNTFVEGILGGEGGCERGKTDLKLRQSSFAGITNYDFELSVQNTWC